MKHIFLFLIMLMTELYATPYNSNILIQRGIDPQILNLSVTTFRQNISYTVQAKYSEQIGDEKVEQIFNILYNPYSQYGIDIKLEIPKKDLENIDESDLKYKLDETMGLQSYLQTRSLYNLKSLKLESEIDNNAVISFSFEDEAIPRELKYFKQLKGYIYISDNILQKIVLKNESNFKHNSVEIENYKKVLKFTKLSLNGGYLLRSVNIKVSGIKNKQVYKSEIHTDVVKYWDKEQEILTYNSGLKDTDLNSNEEYKTIDIELDRLFPLLGQAARKEGYDLPKPYGIALINMFQNTTMHMTSFKVNINNTTVDLSKILDGDSTYENLTYAPLIRADIWVLPFLSVGLLLGVTDTSTDVTLQSESGGPLGIIIQPGDSLALPSFKTNSVLYGVGVTVAGGIGDFFSTIDFQYITSYTSEADVSVEIVAITPLIGYNFDSIGTRAFIGAQYQDLKESLTFDVTVDGKQLSGEVGLFSADWAGVIGANYDFTRNWSTNLLLSYGVDRANATLSIGYRW